MDSTATERRSPTASPLAAPRRYEDLPGPRGLPVVGNLLQIQPQRMHLQLEQWCRDYGPYFRLRLGKRRAIVVGDHAVVAAMMRDRPDGFRRTTRLEEIWTELAVLLGRFEIASVDTPDGGEAREHLSFTMTPVGLMMRLRERG